VSTEEPIVGHWWLRGKPDQRLYGQLEADGASWQLVVGGRFADLADYQMLHGITANNVAITVLDASWRTTRSDQSVLSAPAYLHGVHLPEREEPIGSVAVQVPGAVRLFGHHVQISPTDSVLTVEAPLRVSGPVTLADGTTLKVRLAAQAGHDGQPAPAVVVEPTVTFQFTLATPAPIANVRQQYVFAVRDFVAFGLLARVSDLDARFALPGEGSTSFSFRTSPDDDGAPAASTRRNSDQLLRLGKDDDAADMLRRWFSLYSKHRMAITLLLAPIQAREMYGELRLLSTFMAVESFGDKKFGRGILPKDRDPRIQQVLDHLEDSALHKYAKERLGGGQKGLSRVLDEVIRYSGEIGELVERDLPRFTKRLIKARGKNVAHPGEWGKVSGWELHSLATGLKWIVAACLLREMGLDEADAVQTVKQCDRFSTDLALFHHYGPGGSASLPPPL
jgi:hypothetical protein